MIDQLFTADHAYRWRPHDTLNLHSATALTQIIRMGERARARDQARAAIATSEAQRLDPFRIQEKKGK
jgi:hypothetical protein